MKIIIIIIGIIIASILNKTKAKRNQPDNDNDTDLSIISTTTDEESNKQNDKIKNITKEFIDNTPDDELEWKLMEFILNEKISDFEKQYEAVTSLPKGLIMLYSTWSLEGEVNNGGFNQFFFNSSNQFVNEAYDGLIMINAHKHAQLLKDAVDIFLEEIDMQNEMREQGTLEAFCESYKETKLNDLDSLFYDLDEDLSELRISWIRNNLKEIIC